MCKLLSIIGTFQKTMVTAIIFDWIKEGIELNRAATSGQILSCEEAIGFRFPTDFTQFYFLYNGFKEFNMDSKLLSLWSIEKIQAEYDPSDEFIGFCDYLINSHQIGYIKSQHGIYLDYNRSLICNDFNEFLVHWKNETHEYI